MIMGVPGKAAIGMADFYQVAMAFVIPISMYYNAIC
jgi:hypothetical protein